ncbi:MAG: bifunctional 4-hydroxy-2-oxoglutarate aldolase/2-dehydro-3-deoxy-phosphogluconate aldolase [Planctomycetota bacterium]
MSMDRERILKEIKELRAVAVLRAPSADGAIRACEAMLRGGMRAMEITTTTTDWAKALAGVAALDGAYAGVGTLVAVDQVAVAKDAGARFAVSPGYSPAIADACGAADLPYLPGIATPTELMAAQSHPAVAALKLFPAESLGGVAYMKALKGPFPGVDFLPTGGVSAENAGGYLAAGAIAVGLSAPCKGDLIRDEAWDRIEAIARDVMAAVA